MRGLFMAAIVFLVSFMMCIVIAAAWSVFGHAAWIALFETPKIDSRYPPLSISLQEVNQRLGKLSAFYKAQGFAPDLKEITADPMCKPTASGPQEPVCASALEHEHKINCFQSCMEKYYNEAGCFQESPGVEPSPHCWNVYSGMASARTASRNAVPKSSGEFSQEQKNVYDVIKKKEPFLSSEYGRVITDRACKRTKANVSDAQLQALGGDDCVSIRNS